MRTISFKKALAGILALWERGDYDAALKKVGELQKEWPGNPQLHIMRASLIQLQECPDATLEDAKRALQDAIDLDESSPAAAIELGNFLDAVEDDPKAAAKNYSKAIAQARRLLIEALIAQSKAQLQLGKKEEVLRCLVELFRLTEDAYPAKRSRSAANLDIIMRTPDGQISTLEMKGPYAAQIEQLVSEVLANEHDRVAS